MKTPCQGSRRNRHEAYPRVRKTSWRRAWQPTPVFLPGDSHGQRSLVGCSPQGYKEVIEATWHARHREGAVGPWSPLGDPGVFTVGLGETGGAGMDGSLRSVLQPRAVEWEWGSPCLLLPRGHTAGEGATGTQAPPRPLDPGFLVSALFSGLPGPEACFFFFPGMGFVFSSVLWVKPPQCFIFTFMV